LTLRDFMVSQSLLFQTQLVPLRRVTDKGVRQLAPLVNLESLNIAFTAVTSQGLLALETLNKLQVINLDSCQVGLRTVN
jgi:hypothetical protein